MPSRRHLLRAAAFAPIALSPAAALAPRALTAPLPFTPADDVADEPVPLTGAEHRIALRNVHTGERHDILFARGAQPLPQGLAELNHALRDWRNGQVHRIDFGLVLLVTRLRDRLDLSVRKPIDVISGYRSPATNSSLRAHTDGVASKSQHLLGKAIDVAVPGFTLDRVRDAALSLSGGGVGFYPASGFVHVDTGPVRRW
jgi:uncharacterized protein YcbK (DUF882 family)